MTSTSDIDNLVDDILESQPKVEKETKETPNPVYKRKGKEPVEKPAPEPVVEETPPTREELLARLRAKTRNGSRQAQIQQKKNKSRRKNKNPSFPLTSIYYCDAEGCSSIMPESRAKQCPNCKCFSYCSKECQLKDWTKHKLMCGKDIDEVHAAKLELYKSAREAGIKIINKVKDGNYLTVIHEKGDCPAAMFTTVAEKSNVLNWREYIKNPIFTTTQPSSVGDFSYKIKAAMDTYPNHKIYILSILLDRLLDGITTECVLRLFIADEYGETMNASLDGKVTQKVTRYVRKNK